MVICFASKNALFHLAATNTVPAGICESLNLMLDQAMAAFIPQPQNEVTGLRFSVPDKGGTHYRATNQKSLLLRLFKSKQGPAPRQQSPQFCNIDNKQAPSQNWQLLVDLLMVVEMALLQVIMRSFPNLMIHEEKL